MLLLAATMYLHFLKQETTDRTYMSFPVKCFSHVKTLSFSICFFNSASTTLDFVSSLSLCLKPVYGVRSRTQSNDPWQNIAMKCMRKQLSSTFTRSTQAPFQNEVKCDVFVMKSSYQGWPTTVTAITNTSRQN